MTPQDIISDEEIARVHAHANFGAMSPREVVNEGVRKTAVGYHCGSTQLHILLEHGLATKPRPGSSDVSLTKKGKAYARSIYCVTAPAEARDEGVAAEPVAWRGRDLDAFGGGAWAVCSFRPSCDVVEPLYTHPSPTPTADADLVRIAVEALKPFARLELPKKPVGNAGAYSLLHADIRRAAEAVAALKSTHDGQAKP